jgi:putative component of membrane protein insertase Oxa1/YidC/SpoIIIJ protein YidD
MVKVILIFLSLFSFIQLSAAHYEPINAPWGKDSDLTKAETNVASAPKSKVSTALIRFYQNYISPIDGPRSSYAPSSSEYTLQAIQKYGFIKGYVLGCDRLMRENKALWVYDVIETSEGERKIDPVR